MTDEEKRFDRREEARLDAMYDAQFEPEEENEMKPTQEQAIAWAREAGMEVGAGLLMKDVYGQSPSIEHIQAAIALAYEAGRTAEREKVAAWMIQRSYATGHGDTTEDLLAELDWQIAENWNRAMINGVETEREACAKVCEAGTGEPVQMKTLDILRKERERIAFAIRERGAP